jgi:DNA-binding response OmpR family regulator
VSTVHTAGPGPHEAKILVADDDRIVARIVSTKLSGMGHSVTVVSDGQEALDMLRAGDPTDLLITDRFMPRVNGLELVRLLRADERLRDLPIIMLTASAAEDDIIEGLEAGLDDYVRKPFSPDELAARVRTVLWRAGRGGLG